MPCCRGCEGLETARSFVAVVRSRSRKAWRAIAMARDRENGSATDYGYEATLHIPCNEDLGWLATIYLGV